MSNYTQIRERLGYSSQTDRAFRDALSVIGINPRKADTEGIPEKLVSKIPKNTAVIQASTHNVMSTSVDKIAIGQIQKKLGLDDRTFDRLCKEFGVTRDQSLSQPDAIALCELAMETYGLQLQSELSFVSDRQTLIFKQQQDTAYQLGYLEESSIGNAYDEGRIAARSERLGKQEEEIRVKQNQVFALLGQAGKSIKPQGKSASQAHQEFALGLWQ